MNIEELQRYDWNNHEMTPSDSGEFVYSGDLREFMKGKVVVDEKSANYMIERLHDLATDTIFGCIHDVADDFKEMIEGNKNERPVN